MKRSISLAISIIAAGVLVACAAPQPTSTPLPTATPPPPSPTPPPALGDVQTRPADNMVMVYVPGGEFQMGSTDAEVAAAIELCHKYYTSCNPTWYEREQPDHAVTLSGFWMDQTEVTNVQYATFLNDKGNQEEDGSQWLEEGASALIEQIGGEYQPKSGYADHPVIEVTWYGAAAYCEWAGGRLPTEAEWEYAARGPEGRRFPWGDEFDGTRLNYCDVNCEFEFADTAFDDGYRETAPVGSYPAGASWCGALDMAGNALEWVSDWYGQYPSEPQLNPSGPATGGTRGLRSGSCDVAQTELRCAYRSRGTPRLTYNYVGFRCAKSGE